MASEEFMDGRRLGILEQRIRTLAGYIISSGVPISPRETMLEGLYAEYEALALKHGLTGEHFREITKMYYSANEKH